MNITKETLRLYWDHARRYPLYLYGTFVTIPMAVLINQFIPPLIVADILARLGKHDYNSHDIWGSFGPSLLTYAILVILGGIFAWRIGDSLNWKLEGKVHRDMAQRIYDHLLRQSATFHANNFSGSLVSQTSKFMSGYVRIADTTMYQVIPLITGLLAAVVILGRRAPVYVAILLAFSALYIVTAFFVTKPVRKISAKHANAESKQTGYLADSITNVMAIKSFSGSPFERKAFAKHTEQTRNWLLTLMHAHAKQQMYFGGLMNLIAAVALVMAVVSVMVWNADIATVFLILSYTNSIVSQLFTFSNTALRNYNRALGDAVEMTKILHTAPEVQDIAKPEKSMMKTGEIKFDTVIFSHDGANDALFSGLDLHIQPGEKIGLVGHSGSGKTTLTRVLLRFSDIDGGTITIDGQNISSVTQDDLRTAIAYVPQEPLLFHRSIKENIAYGRPGASDEQIFEAARKANAAEFIEQLQDGYQTLVGERGVKLSGGQRQRIVIARAILKDAPILVLDEATSALDSESELLIQAALQELMKKRTAIVIAHRLSTIQKMDRIIVLEKGVIVEQGSHNELVKQQGVYAQLWAHQSGGFIEE